MTAYAAVKVPSPAGDLSAQVQPGPGPVVVFQHGLCGDAAQPAEVFPSGQGFRHAVLECRGHGSSPLGAPDAISLATFAQDVAGLIQTLDRKPLAVGGISMGAAIALHLAVRRPDLVPALILARPAWGTKAAPPNLRPNAEVGAALAQGQGVAAFDASPTGRQLAAEAPDNFATLRGFFARQPLAATATLLSRISADGPGVTARDLAALTIPVLIIGTQEDHIHPMALARDLAHMIPTAQLVEVPPKGRDRAAHVAAMHATLLHFMKGLNDAASAR